MNKHSLQQIIADITGRQQSLLAKDMAQNKALLQKHIANKSVLIIGGAGTIGSSYIMQLLHFSPKRLFVIDVNENGLAELVRDIRSSNYPHLPSIKTYPINFGSHIFEQLFINEGPFDIVANFAALKHVRSAKDEYAIEAMFENNFMLANKLLVLLKKYPPQHFFCVSTDKATQPVSIMGATKKLMEDVIFSYQNDFNVTTARFANVAFSNGSLLESYIKRLQKQQPLVCPADIKRFFVSPEEAGQLCLLACILGESGDIFFPKLNPNTDLVPFTKTLSAFLDGTGQEGIYCKSEKEAIQTALNLPPNCKQQAVYVFKSDTSGEKPYEEFYAPDDLLDVVSFLGLGVIKRTKRSNISASVLMQEANKLFAEGANKDSIVAFLHKYIDDFNYLDKGKNLDEKM